MQHWRQPLLLTDRAAANPKASDFSRQLLFSCKSAARHCPRARDAGAAATRNNFASCPVWPIRKCQKERNGGHAASQVECCCHEQNNALRVQIYVAQATNKRKIWGRSAFEWKNVRRQSIIIAPDWGETVGGTLPPKAVRQRTRLFKRKFIATGCLCIFIWWESRRWRRKRAYYCLMRSNKSLYFSAAALMFSHRACLHELWSAEICWGVFLCATGAQIPVLA